MIPIFEPFLIGNAKKYLNECLDTNWISSQGKFVTKFENYLKNFFKVKFAISCSNGTSAIHLALKSLGLKAGDEILCPALTFIAPANMIILSNFNLKLVDIEIDTLNIDPNLIEKKITKKTKAILVVHQFGHSAKMNKIIKIAKKYSLKVVEDNAESFGGKYNGNYLGTLGDLGTLSFFGNKFITTGEGGAILTNNKKFAEKCKILRDHGMSPNTKYKHLYLGFNYRMTNMQAAIGLSQMENIRYITKLRNMQMKLYYQKLSKNKNFYCREFASWCVPSHWLMTIILKNKNNKKKFINYMLSNKIECRSMIQPVFKANHFSQLDKINDFKISKFVSERSIHLPSSTSLTTNEIDKICRTIKVFFLKYV
tara:strand:- start:7381 stop:8484 length:1104 start_codon:yes stop_codon:yes gene_type:complete